MQGLIKGRLPCGPGLSPPPSTLQHPRAVRCSGLAFLRKNTSSSVSNSSLVNGKRGDVKLVAKKDGLVHIQQGTQPAGAPSLPLLGAGGLSLVALVAFLVKRSRASAASDE